MATTTHNKLKRLSTDYPPGTPLTAQTLASGGISADLAVHYVKAGWLHRLSRGVYCRPGQPLLRDASLLVLQTQIAGLHVGGKTSLDWYGIRHYVAAREILTLYSWTGAHIPGWFTDRFPNECHRKRLFRETPTVMSYVTPFERQEGRPLTSEPERGLLELLSEVGVRQPIQEAREIMEGAYTMRPDVLNVLLQDCTSVKTVRLCMQLAREIQLPWIDKINIKQLPTGSNRPWVSKSRDGLIVLKP